MADYVAQPDTAVDPDAPVTSDLMYALRDNPVAISEGAAGAPRIQDAAMSTTVTTAGRNWVANRYGSQASTGVGQVVMARYQSSGSGLTRSVGGSANGSELTPCNANAGVGSTPITLPGTWVCQGYAESGVTTVSVTTWKRTS